MEVYLSDPLVRTLIDLPCLYATKDGYDIVTEDEALEEDLVYLNSNEELSKQLGL